MKLYTEYAALERRSTERLRKAWFTALHSECECDSYHGYTCPIHRRVEMIEDILERRGALQR